MINPVYNAIVFETLKAGGAKRLRRLLDSGRKVYILEPFVAYHKVRGKIIGFPDDLPGFAMQAVRVGSLSLISADDLGARNIYQVSIDRAVDLIEKVWPAYLLENERIIRFTGTALDSRKADNAFKRALGERLAEFLSAHEVYRRVCQHVSPDCVRLYADTNVHSYMYMQRLLKKAGCGVQSLPRLRFPKITYWQGLFEDVAKTLKFTTRVSAQALVSLWRSKRDKPDIASRTFTYGTTIISPRQLRDNMRTPDFFVDGKVIKNSEVLYFPLFPMSSENKTRLERCCENTLAPPGMGQFFSDPVAWFGLLLRSVMNIWQFNGEEIRTASLLIFHYFVWKYLLHTYRLRHFVTHCDFTLSHMGRNIALRQAGVTSWYFTDSMNFGNNLVGYIPGCRMRHPYWTYLDYDHFVTWHQGLADYFLSHTESFRQAHVVGCLWAANSLPGQGTGRKRLPFTGKVQADFFIAVFDTTYARNITINYTEGIAFAEQILKMAELFPTVCIAFKEKKSREIHSVLDHDNGPRLTAIYDRMAKRENIVFLDNNSDASELIQVADMVVSFPFTSTTFEALSINKAAIWHDPLSFYRSNLYADENGVVTHGIDELKDRIQMEMRHAKNETGGFQIPAGSPLMDPYRDGKAVVRFRQLLSEING